MRRAGGRAQRAKADLIESISRRVPDGIRSDERWLLRDMTQLQLHGILAILIRTTDTIAANHERRVRRILGTNELTEELIASDAPGKE